jgi:glycosyltransferase involved in cell wall biosynthesis
MCVKDEADLLPEVLPHVKALVDNLYVYDDGSTDGTWDLIQDVTYAIQKESDATRLDIKRPHYHHLLEKIKEDYDVDNEEVWAVITMGDRFFLNKTPRQIVEDARAGGYDAVEGVQLDFLRHRMDPWTEENDDWPNYSVSLRHQCRWFRVDERCIVAFRVTSDLSYLEAKYPWPKGLKNVQHKEDADNTLSLDIPYLEHQGRRSPKAAMWRYGTGSRPISKKFIDRWDLSTFESTAQALRLHYQNYRLFPWLGLSSLETLVEWWNVPEFHKRTNLRWFFKGVEMGRIGTSWPRRTDIPE